MKQYKKLITPYVLFLFLLTVLPMVLIVFYAFTQKASAIKTFEFTFANFAKFFDPIFVQVLIKSFGLGLLTFMISKCKQHTQTILIMLITIPTWINLLMRTYAWVSILSRNGILNNILGMLGLGSFRMLYTDGAVAIGMIYNFLPFMILPIHTSLTNMDPSLVEAAYDLGANKITAFFKITFKLSLGGVLTGITMVFLPAISEFVIPKMLGGGQYSLIGNFIENQFITVGNWHFGSAVSLILGVIVIISMALIYRAEKKTNNEIEQGGLTNAKRKKAQ